MKLEKLYHFGDNKEVKGYKFGEYYLMKHYGWGNSYSWIINKTGENFYTSNEFSRAYDNGEVITVGSFKQGKQKLIELASK